jgi:hypothetical protein
MSDSGHIELTWDWTSLIPLAAVLLLLVAAIWSFPHRVRIWMALGAILVAWIFTVVQGPLPWATLAQAIMGNLVVTIITLLVLFAIGLVAGRKK